MLFRFAKFTFAMFVLLSIVRTALWTKNLLMQDGFLDAPTTSSWFASPDLNFPNPTTIFLAHDEIVASVSKFFAIATSAEAILFFASLTAAVWLAGLGFTRLARALEQRHSHWPEPF
jgi:hypothetical protein